MEPAGSALEPCRMTWGRAGRGTRYERCPGPRSRTPRSRRRCRPGRNARLRAHPPAVVLDPEHLGGEVGGVLPALPGQGEVPQRVADVRLDLLPEESDVPVAE